MTQTSIYDPSRFYIIRADKAGVFIGKIKHADGTTLQVSNLRRLYRWSGALDVTQIAANGVSGENKFSVQFGDDDLSVIYNVIECHPVSDKALETINNIKAWKIK